MKTDQAYTQLRILAETETDPGIKEIWGVLAESYDRGPQASAQLIGLFLAAMSGAIMGSVVMWGVMR
jgi:hypothetical protein